jgi:hypothetical protein
MRVRRTEAGNSTRAMGLGQPPRHAAASQMPRHHSILGHAPTQMGGVPGAAAYPPALRRPPWPCRHARHARA